MGGAVGGTVVIAIAVVGVFFLRRQPTNRSSPAFVIDVPSRPHRESQKALSDDGNHTRSSTIGAPIVPMRFYVRTLRPHISIAFLSAHCFCPSRTRMTQPHFQRTQNLSMPRTALPNRLFRSTTEPETPWLTCTSHGYMNITTRRLLKFHPSVFYTRDSDVAGFMFAKAFFCYLFGLPWRRLYQDNCIISTPWMPPNLHHSGIAVTSKDHFIAPYNSCYREGDPSG